VILLFFALQVLNTVCYFKGPAVPDFSTQTWTYIVVGLVAVFAVGVFARVRNLMQVSKEIESKLDYSKMKKWEDEDDDWGKPESSPIDQKRGGPE